MLCVPGRERPHPHFCRSVCRILRKHPGTSRGCVWLNKKRETVEGQARCLCDLRNVEHTPSCSEVKLLSFGWLKMYIYICIGEVVYLYMYRRSLLLEGEVFSFNDTSGENWGAGVKKGRRCCFDWACFRCLVGSSHLGGGGSNVAAKPAES